MYQSAVRDYLAQSAHRNIRDFNFGEHCYYGKLNNYYSPVFLSEQDDNLKNLGAGQGEKNFKALNFVADLFNEMAREFERCATTSVIKKDDPFLSNLKVYRAHASFDKEYANYLQIFTDQLINVFSSRSIHVENFEQFMTEFMNVAPTILSKISFTKAAYIKSQNNTIFTSGLAIEIADLSYENDEEKRAKFLESKNWPFFVNACNKYGFLIDYNIPWRIVCDIRAPEIAPYMEPYGYISGFFLLDLGYRKASTEGVSELPKILLQMYDKIRKGSFIKTKVCTDGTILKEKVTSKTYTLGELKSRYDFTYFSKIYLLLRLMEEEPPINDSQKRRLVKDILTLVTSTGSYLPIEYFFERHINKTLDKPFTIDYYINVVRPAMLNRLFDQGELLAYSADR
jgi:hypothetical protein